MKCFTIHKGRVSPGIVVEGGFVSVGESGRGRRLVRFRIPAAVMASDVEPTGRGNMVVESGDAPGALVLIRDHSGYRGSWSLQPHGCSIIAEGWCAQGDAGRMGGGPEYLLRIMPGQSVEIVRSGRLYGAPSRIRVDCSDLGIITCCDPESTADEQLASARLSACFNECPEAKRY